MLSICPLISSIFSSVVFSLWFLSGLIGPFQTTGLTSQIMVLLIIPNPIFFHLTCPPAVICPKISIPHYLYIVSKNILWGATPLSVVLEPGISWCSTPVIPSVKVDPSFGFFRHWWAYLPLLSISIPSFPNFHGITSPLNHLMCWVWTPPMALLSDMVLSFSLARPGCLDDYI